MPRVKRWGGGKGTIHGGVLQISRHTGALPLKFISCLLQTEIIRKRLNKDIPHHPVIMLNFCPDLRTSQPDLRETQGEFIFLIDRSGSMSGTNINRVKVPQGGKTRLLGICSCGELAEH